MSAPLGIQLGLMVGFVLAGNASPELPFVALVLCVTALPVWFDRLTRGALRRSWAAIRHRPVAPLRSNPSYHFILLLAPKPDSGALLVMAITLLAPFVLGWVIPMTRPAGRPAASPYSPFAGPSKGRHGHVAPALLTLGGALLALVGTLLPWAFLINPVVGQQPENGLTFSVGWFTFGLALAIAIAGATRLGASGRAGWRRGIAIGAGLGLATFAYWLVGDLASEINAFPPPTTGSIGPGALFIGAGGLAAFVGGLLPGRPATALASNQVLGAIPISGRAPVARG